MLFEKTGYNKPQKQQLSNHKMAPQQKVRLNLNKFPADFFPKAKVRRNNSTSERLTPTNYNQFNQFIDYHRTVDLLACQNEEQDQFGMIKQISVFKIRGESQSKPREQKNKKKEVFKQSSKKTSHDTKEICFPGALNFDEFNCTFSKKFALQSNKNHFEIKKEKSQPSSPKKLSDEHSWMKNELTNHNAIKRSKIQQYSKFQRFLKQKMTTDVDIDLFPKLKGIKKVNLPLIQSARKAGSNKFDIC